MANYEFRTDVSVSGKVEARRLNEGMIEQTLSAQLGLSATAAGIYSLNADTTNFPVLPNATDLPLGWTVRIINSGSGTFPVKTNDPTTPVTLVTIAPDEFYTFVCVDNSSTAGVWKYIKETAGDLQPAARYVASFNAGADWTLTGENYTRTILAATHGMGTTPTLVVQQNVSGAFNSIGVAHSINASGDITLIVNATPLDCRLAGRVIIS